MTRHTKKQQVCFSKEKKKSTETISEKDIMADILHKDFKTIVLKMLKELKENGIKSRKWCVNKMEISIKRQKTKRTKKKFWSYKKNNWNEKLTIGIQRQIEQEEERASQLEDRTMKIIKSEEKKEKRLKKSKRILRDLWDTIKRTKTSTVAVPVGGESEKGAERIWRHNN